jgi:hypothetical protein
MKYHSLLVFLFVSTIAFAQVPEKQGSGSGFSSGIGVTMRHSTSRKVSISQKGKMFSFNIPDKGATAYIYESLEFSKYGFIVKKDGKYGIANHNAQIKSKFEYDSIGIDNFSKEQLYIVKKNGKYGLMDTLGKVYIKLNYEDIRYKKEGEYYLTLKKNLYGALKYNGQVLMQPRFNRIEFCSSTFPFAFIKNEEGKVQMFDIKNKKLNPLEFDLAILYNNLIVTKINKKMGAFFIDSLGYTNNTLPVEYDRITPSTSFIRKGKESPEIIADNIGRKAFEVIVEKDSKFSLINNQAKPIIPEEFDQISAHLLFDGSYYYKLKNGAKYGAYFSKTGKMIAVEMDYIEEGSKDALIVKKGQNYGVYSTNAEPIIPLEYHKIESKLFGYQVVKERKVGLFDDKGRLLVPVQFDDVSNFYDKDNNEYFKVEENGLIGIYRVGTGIIIPTAYNFILRFADNFLVSTKGEQRKQGILDKDGKVIIPVENNWIYSSLEPEQSITIVERQKGEHYFYNQKWQKILAEPIAEFNFLHDTDNLIFIPQFREIGYMYVQNAKGKVGLLNLQSHQLVIPFDYDAILQKFKSSKTSYLLAIKSGKYGVVNEKNEIIIPFQYDYMNLDLMLEQISEDPNKKVDYRFVAANKGKFGVVNLENKATVPFEYKQLERVGGEDIFKAKKDSSYILINADNLVLNNGPFDEIGQFEFTDGRGGGKREAMAFQKGHMRMISSQGEIKSSPIAMLPSKGYKSFWELKKALVAALESKDSRSLKEFAVRVSPSAQTLFYFQGTHIPAKFQDIEIDHVIDLTFQQLLQFKEHTWSDPRFDKSILMHTNDYNKYEEGLLSNYSAVFNRYSDDRFLERLLGDCVKINGNWISTYFTFLYR